MTLDGIMAAGIGPALAWLPPKMNSPEVLVMLLATGLQESRFEHRFQVTNEPGVKGPARSFWQMERNGGVVGVLTHPASRELAVAACERQGVPAEKMAVWLAIERDDFLAAVFARLLYWTTPGALPRVTQEDAAFGLYAGTWRPGAYTNGNATQRAELRAKWGRNHEAARTFLEFP